MLAPAVALRSSCVALQSPLSEEQVFSLSFSQVTWRVSRHLDGITYLSAEYTPCVHTYLCRVAGLDWNVQTLVQSGQTF